MMTTILESDNKIINILKSDNKIINILPSSTYLVFSGKGIKKYIEDTQRELKKQYQE